MIKANIFGAESAIEFLNTNDLKEAIRQFVENDQITLPSAFTKLKLDTDKDLSSLPKEVKPEADEMKAYMAAYTMEEYRADVFKMLAINIWRLYMQYSENGSTAGECFLMMLKGNGRIPFLGKLLKEAAADLRKEKMRAERDYCNRESEKRLRSEKEKNMGCVCIHIIIVEL